jgi:NAD(P)-dependent dehydrogenase (short-subunit alcohol dehydrogenase family)
MPTRVVVITGGFGTLGRAVTSRFTAEGDKVARVDFARTAPDSTAALDIGGVDITAPDVAEQAIARITAELGAPSVLVNIAGGFAWATLEAGGPETWERMFRMNVLTAVSMTKAALPALKSAASGCIVNIGANGALKAGAGMGGYTASKSGVHRLTESLAEELRGTGVTVNAIMPTTIDTPVNRSDMPNADFSEWVRPDAIADVILFLASPAARAITGALIPVSRGTPSQAPVDGSG